MAARAGMAGGVDCDRAGCDNVIADHCVEGYRAGSQRRTIGRAADSDRAGQRKFADGIVARYASEAVVAGGSAAQRAY